MLKRWNWVHAARLFILALILGAVLCLIGPAARLMRSYGQREMQVNAEAIDKALVQCFALEGSYPSDLQYLVDHYGLILDTDKYVYTLDTALNEDYVANFKPNVTITLREEAVEP